MTPLLALALVALPAQNPATRIDTSYGCTACHSELRRSAITGVHSEAGIRCHDCHGGNPRSFEASAGHAGRFIGTPNKMQTLRMCADCHSDPNQMRPYELPADQVAELRASRHGELLFAGRFSDAPTCTDCHDAHIIRRALDARSNVHPLNVSETCRGCHEDQAMMDRHNLATTHYEDFVAGAHGRALFDEGNFASPTCISCHGSHAARSISDDLQARSCATCHVGVGDAFQTGPHGGAVSGEMGGCRGCHTSHGAEPVAIDSVSAQCRQCHTAGSGIDSLGIELQDVLEHAHAALEGADHAMAQLVEFGERIGDAGFRYSSTLTTFNRIRQLQHGLSLSQLEELGRRLESSAAEVERVVEIREEHRWEHKLLMVPVWFLALSTVVFAWFKARESRSNG